MAILFIISFFFFRLVNILLLPIFNDESIYLDWGYREIHSLIPFYSLYDSKPPLLLWVYGVLESYIPDPLLAGRIVSVITGLILVIGIWRLSILLFNKKTGIISTLFYSFIPIFIFYDKQALMESALSAAGVWSIYFFISYLKTNKVKFITLTGILLGLGFWIKYSMIIYIAAIFVTYFIAIIKSSNKLLKTTEFFYLLITISTITLALILQPEFFNTIGLNKIYTLTLSELFKFPVSLWINNMNINFQIVFFFFTPFILFLSVAGLILFFIKKQQIYNIFSLLIILPIILETLTVRNSSIRYIASFLPLLVIPAAYTINILINKKKSLGIILFLISIFLPIFASIIQLINPVYYINIMAKITPFSPTEYTTGITSGIQAKTAIDYIKELSYKKNVLLVMAPHTGNPESAFTVYFRNYPNAVLTTINSKDVENEVNNIDCLNTNKPTYFIARDVELENMNKFFELIKEFKTNSSAQTVDIYKLKENCQGTNATINIVDTGL